jgi:hypothetical protein
MTPTKPDDSEPPRDVLAAEEFAVPAPDPALKSEPPHDVLAAEEFPLPAPDFVVHHHRPVPLPPDPDDPSGSEPPHDVLAAEEFAVPGTAPHSLPPDYEPVPPRPPARAYLPLCVLTAAAFGVTLIVLRRRQRTPKL